MAYKVRLLPVASSNDLLRRTTSSNSEDEMMLLPSSFFFCRCVHPMAKATPSAAVAAKYRADRLS